MSTKVVSQSHETTPSRLNRGCAVAIPTSSVIVGLILGTAGHGHPSALVLLPFFIVFVAAPLAIVGAAAGFGERKRTRHFPKLSLLALVINVGMFACGLLLFILIVVYLFLMNRQYGRAA